MQIEEDPAYSLSINQERRDGLPLSPEYGSPRPQLIMTPSLKPLWLKILFFLRIHPVLKPVVENMAQIVLIFLVFITLSSALVFQLLLLTFGAKMHVDYLGLHRYRTSGATNALV